MPVAVLIFVNEKTPVRITGERKNKTTRINAGAMNTQPSLADMLIALIDQ